MNMFHYFSEEKFWCCLYWNYKQSQKLKLLNSHLMNICNYELKKKKKKLVD